MIIFQLETRKKANVDSRLLAFSSNAYLDLCQATVLQNRVMREVLEFQSDHVVVTDLMLNLVGMFRDKSLYWLKFVDDAFMLNPRDLERLFFHRLCFQQDEDVYY